jgi:hypothetical protein
VFEGVKFEGGLVFIGSDFFDESPNLFFIFYNKVIQFFDNGFYLVGKSIGMEFLT